MPTDLDKLAEDAARAMFPHDPSKAFATWSEVFKPMDLLTDPRWLGPMRRRIMEMEWAVMLYQDRNHVRVELGPYTPPDIIVKEPTGPNADLIAVARTLVVAHKAKTPDEGSE